jgi:muconolactone delta-isomerase
MKILALEREKSGSKAADFQPYLVDEARAAWQLVQAGIFREMYFIADKHTAVIMLEADSAAEAKEILARLPLAQAGLITFEMIALQPYDGFERLFK